MAAMYFMPISIDSVKIMISIKYLILLIRNRGLQTIKLMGIKIYYFVHQWNKLIISLVSLVLISQICYFLVFSAILMKFAELLAKSIGISML